MASDSGCSRVQKTGAVWENLTCSSIFTPLRGKMQSEIPWDPLQLSYKKWLPYLLNGKVIFRLCFYSDLLPTCLSQFFTPWGKNHTLPFKRFPQISLSLTLNDRMIRKNIPKTPTQHPTYRPRHLVDVRRRERDGERRRPQVLRLKNGKGEERTALIFFQYHITKTYLLFFIDAPTHGSLRSLSSSWCYLAHPLLPTKRSAPSPADVLSPAGSPDAFSHFGKRAQLLLYLV